MHTGVYMDKVLLEKELPIKMVAYGRCFRTEAGAAGAAGKGLYRVHQFTKVGAAPWARGGGGFTG
jgi:seryl-tRNA synthetase